MDRILRSTPATVTLNNYDATGALVNPPGGAMTADVKDSAGVAIAGSPFTVPNPPGVTGVLSFAIGAGVLTVLDVYTVTWHYTDGSTRTSEFEVVGGFIFTIADCRAFAPELAGTATPLVATTTIVQIRNQVEEKFEAQAITDRAFRPRGRRVTLDGTGTRKILVPDGDLRTVVSGSISGTALTAGDLADLDVKSFGLVTRKSVGGWGSGVDVGDVELLYEFGLDQPPAEINRAALEYAFHLLFKSALETPRATAVFGEYGGYRLSIAGRDGPTGLPNVDAALAQWARAWSKGSGLGAFA